MHRVDHWPLGRQVHFTHPRWGLFTTHAADGRPGTDCTWFGRYRLPGNARPVDLMLAGTASAPLRSQLTAVGRILEALDEVKYDLRRRITRHAARYPGIVADQWNGSPVLITNNDTDTATMEVTFEWGAPPALRSLAVYWAGGRLVDGRW